MAIKAILWDGQKQLNGELILKLQHIEFRFSDFSDTDINFDLSYDDIKEVGYHKIFDLPNVGLVIESMNGNKNIFIIEKPEDIKTIIEKRKNLAQSDYNT